MVDWLTDQKGDVLQRAGNIPFGNADKLWESFQNKMNSFVNNNHGNATVSKAEIHRPDWSLVKAVLQGKQPLSKLSKDCPDIFVKQ